MPEYSLFNMGGLTKPVTVLIEKISNAVGTLWEPKQIRRIAQAEADAAMILVKGEIEIDEVRRRAVQRFVEEETRKQLNMESIVNKAIQDVDPNAPTGDVEDDWITNFFDKCRSVSDDDMQGLWSRILSGEANSPGSFSRKTVNLVADLEKASAELFQSLCCFGWQFDGNLTPLILDFSNRRMYTQRGVTLFSLGGLESIGLIRISSAISFVLSELPKRVTASYHGRSVQLTLPKDTSNTLDVGQVIMTSSGLQLSRIVKCDPVDGFFEFIYDSWEGKSLIPPLND